MNKIVQMQAEPAAKAAWEKEQRPRRQECPEKKPVREGLETWLTEQSRAALDGWLAENLTYEAIKNRLQVEFQIAVNITTIGRYRARHFKELLARSKSETPLVAAPPLQIVATVQIEGHARFSVTTRATGPVTITPNGTGTTIEIHG